MSFRRSILAAVLVFVLTVSPVAHADTIPSLNDPFTEAIQFWSGIIASIEAMEHQLATALIPHQSQLTDSSNPNVSNNLNPPPAANPFTAAVADALPDTAMATSSETPSTATSDQTTQSPFVKSPVLSTATWQPTTNPVIVKTAPFTSTASGNSPPSVSEQYQFDALSNRLSNLTGIVGNLASLLPSLAQNENSATAQQFLGDGNPEAIGAGAAIDQLNNVTITNPSISGLSASDIPNLSDSYLSLGGGTLTGALADSGTAGSSFAGALGIGTTSPSDVLAVNGPIFLGNVTPAATASRLYNSGGSLYWNGNALAVGGSGASTTTPNIWTALQQFANASTTAFSAYGPAYFGSSATSSFASNGGLTLAQVSRITYFDVLASTLIDGERAWL
jgi:hypothetical protein